MNLFKKNVLVGGISLAVAALSGCAAISTEINHGSLQTSTKMSNTIFLPPFPEDEKRVYVSVKNTSDQDVEIQNLVEQDLQQRGYTITTNVSGADAILQVNILQAGKSTQSAVSSAFTDGFGGALLGATAGGLVGQDWQGAAVGGLAGAAVSSLADAVVKDVVYSMITDVQISAKVPDGIMTIQTTTSNLQQGTGTTVSSQSSAKSNMQLYQTRIVSTADKTNLDFKEAKPILEKNLAHEIANLF